jgi:hypothetical protein
MQDVVPLNSEGGVYFNFWDDINHNYPKNAYVGSMPWTKQVFNFKTSPITNQKIPAYFTLLLRNCKGTVWFDDVCLVELDNK